MNEPSKDERAMTVRIVVAYSYLLDVSLVLYPLLDWEEALQRRRDHIIEQ